jgi:pimeloyl-ACP methyl ester carboxylesterase
MRRRAAEPWFESACAAMKAAEGGDESAETTLGWQPFRYGRWDEAAREHAAAGLAEEAAEVRAGFYAEGAFDPSATRAGLAGLAAPVLVYAGELDAAAPPGLLAGVAGPAGLFPGWELTVQPGAAHFPWLDDPAWFTAALTAFLAG